MLLVIFGAGASYDSVPHFWPPSYGSLEQHRLPLANKLFDDRDLFVHFMTRFDDCLEVVPILRKNGCPVERELAKLQAQAATFPMRHQQLAAIRYYLHSTIWECQRNWRLQHKGITNYGTFLDAIERWRYMSQEEVCFVTFNYDTMLEQEMTKYLGFQLENFDDYIRQKNYSLIKIHGSINWGRQVEISEASGHIDHKWIIAHATELKITDRYRFATFHPMLREGGDVIFPALAIPVENKDEFSCPESHKRILDELLMKVTKIIVVGWRATENDFLSLLRGRLKRGEQDVLIVSGDQSGADETIANIRDHVILRSRVSVAAQGFTGLTNSLDTLEGFLGGC